MADSRYDPHIPAGGNGNDKTAAIQHEIDSTVRQMRQNIDAVNDRGEGLDSLGHKTDNLADSAGQFRRGANRVRKQMWWKDMKMRVCIIVGIIIVLLLIIVPSAVLGGK